MWIQTIRINLIFRVFLALYRPQFTGQYIMNPSKRRSRRSIEKSDEEQKSKHSSDQSDCYSYIVFPKQKRMKLMKGNMLQSDDVMVPNMRVRKFQIDPKNLRSLLLTKFFLTLMRLKKSQERMITILITIKSPSLGNSKLLLDKIIQAICFIFWTSLHSTEIHHQMK